MKIITTPDGRLREKSEKVRKIDDEIRGIIADMRKLSLNWEAKHPYELSAAMAAPQMGVLKRIIIVRDDMEDKKKATFTALINPEVIRAEGKIKKDYEGCLSVPTEYGMVPRHTKVKVKAELDRLEIENFIPMTYRFTESRKQGDTELRRELVPAINNLIFVHSTKERISELKVSNELLEPLRYMIDQTAGEAHTIMTVPDKQMENFMGDRGTGSSSRQQFHLQIINTTFHSILTRNLGHVNRRIVQRQCVRLGIKRHSTISNVITSDIASVSISYFNTSNGDAVVFRLHSYRHQEHS
jgi:peptide deformylase